jgi:hypothetical protein
MDEYEYRESDGRLFRRKKDWLDIEIYRHKQGDWFVYHDNPASDLESSPTYIWSFATPVTAGQVAKIIDSENPK